eukprot:jgi/Mesen1/5382/ME000268S04580
MADMDEKESKGGIFHGINQVVNNSIVGSYFKMEARGTCLTTEIRAGTATFLTMAYILAVNAAILTASGGPCDVTDCRPIVCSDSSVALSACSGLSTNGTSLAPECLDVVKKDLIVATAASALIGCLIMGIFANVPLALAPGMGTNAYFAYTVVGFHGTGKISYEQALAAVFIEGWLFLLIAVTGFRTKMAKLIPTPVRISTAAGIGAFLAHIGLQGGEGVGLVTFNSATLVTLGACPPDSRQHLAPVMTNAATGEVTVIGPVSDAYHVVGFVIIAYALVKNVKGAMIYGIVFVTGVSWFRDTEVVDFHTIKKTAGVFSFSAFDKSDLWVALITFLYVDLMDTTGTLYSMARFAGLIIGSCLGSSPVTVFIESATGLKEGGKTGFTSCVVAFYFFIAFFFTPLLASIPPWAVGAPLFLVGAMMMKSVREIDWDDMKQAIPAFTTIILMPLTYSIAYGVIGGICTYIVLNLWDWAWMLAGYGPDEEHAHAHADSDLAAKPAVQDV